MIGASSVTCLGPVNGAGPVCDAGVASNLSEEVVNDRGRREGELVTIVRVRRERVSDKPSLDDMVLMIR